MYKIVQDRPEMRPYEKDINLRMDRFYQKKKELAGNGSLSDFANAYLYYGFHRTSDCWIYREWAPAADRLYLAGDFNGWKSRQYPMRKLRNGNWELKLPLDVLHHGDRVMTFVKNGRNLTRHIPLYAMRAVQDEETGSWYGEVWDNSTPYPWTDQNFKRADECLIYEAHVGMSGEEERVATYREFADNVLPHVQDLGYNTVQLMGIMEHPYYGSFGYQVSNFYAASSRSGTPDDLKYLINKAHDMGISVLLDVVHSHAVKNTVEGINCFDGTEYQFFHEGGQGEHPDWGTKLFNYDKPGVLNFLLSNLKFWMIEYHFDGFRFDGVTSMLYHDHGMGSAFSMDKYFTMNTDVEAITYLQLANALIREVNPKAVTIAEDMSGMPGMCEKIEDGGIGFSYRLAMGLPDMWIRLIRDCRDEDWNLEYIWRELCGRREMTIAYAESHDQALVGDKTIMFRLADAAMYTDMDKICHTEVIDRAMALHKMIRLITASAGGDGYLNFMGNEFGHPEWIDFPREGNGWSYFYARRQWSLLENGYLKYQQLNAFDKDMLAVIGSQGFMHQQYPDLRYMHFTDHLIAYERSGWLFAFNFHPTKSYDSFRIPVKDDGDYEVILSSDDSAYGGYGRVAHMTYHAGKDNKGKEIQLYLPSRTCVVLKKKK